MGNVNYCFMKKIVKPQQHENKSDPSEIISLHYEQE